MKKLSQLLKAYIKWLEPVLHVTKIGAKKKKVAELEKAWLRYAKLQKSKAPASEKQRELLYQFIHNHRENTN